MDADVTIFQNLPLRVRQRRGEPAYALFDRLAVRNGFANGRELAATVRLDYQSIFAGHRIHEVACLAGFKPELVEQWTVVRDRKSTRFQGVGYHASEWALKARRVCLGCLKADRVNSNAGPLIQRTYRRFWWDFSPVTTCPDHRMILISDCPTCKKRLPELAFITLRCTCGVELDSIPEQKLSAQCVKADAYLIQRLVNGGTGSVPVLNGMPVRTAAAALSRIGWHAMNSREPPARLDPADPAAAAQRSAGLAIFELWPGAFQELLDHLAMVAPTAANQSGFIGPRTTYGPLYEWLDQFKDSSLDVIRRELALHYRETQQTSGRTRLFGAEVQDATFVTLAEANKRCDLHPTSNALLPLLAEMDVITDKKMRKIDIKVPTHILADLASAKRSAMNMKQVAEYLGLNLSSTVMLHRAGRLKSLANSNRGEPLFFREEIDQFLIRLQGEAKVIRKLPPNCAKLVDAARSYGGLEFAIDAILDNRLQLVGSLRRTRGIEAFVVNLDHIREAKWRRSSADKLPLVGARKLLRVSETIMSSLTKAGLIQKELLGHEWYVPYAEVRRFARNYVSAADLAQLAGSSSHKIIAVFEAGGVTPAIGPPEHRMHFFQREQVLALTRKVGWWPASKGSAKVSGNSVKVWRKLQSAADKIPLCGREFENDPLRSQISEQE